ncbi:MAG TPA: PAS domain S-box protein [Candidatus Thermoplasmatota archaeon]|nr:PAS domain S-box protein [Candidatus Thermoplasmatota archaeon]
MPGKGSARGRRPVLTGLVLATDLGLASVWPTMGDGNAAEPPTGARLAERLKGEERRFRDLIDHAPIAVLEISLDGRVLLANHALAKLLGYVSVKELQDQSPTTLSHHLAPGDLKQIDRILRAGPPYRPLELRIRRRDESQVWVDVQAQPGVAVGERLIEAFIRDLTQVRAAQLASLRLEAVVNSMDDAIIGIDAHGIVRSWNRGATNLYGYVEAEAVGRPIVEVFVPTQRRSEWDGTVATLMAGQRLRKFETLRRCKDGATKEVAVVASPILDADGQVLGASFIENDAGEGGRAQNAALAKERQRQELFHLEELTRMRTEFIAKASHELNTPLTPVLLEVQFLKDVPGLDARQALSLASIERNVMRLAVLVKDLLAAADLNMKRLDLNPSAIDLRELVSDAVESFQPQAQKTGVTLLCVGDRAVPAFADRDRIMQVLFNVVGNAIKFTPRGGSVTVTATELDGQALATIADTGLGFSERDRGNLFLPFGRLHEDKPGAPPGTGLGLFIAKGIIEESGGEIWAESPGPGRGCTFCITLPMQGPSRPGRGVRSARGFSRSEIEIAPPRTK